MFLTRHRPRALVLLLALCAGIILPLAHERDHDSRGHHHTAAAHSDGWAAPDRADDPGCLLIATLPASHTAPIGTALPVLVASTGDAAHGFTSQVTRPHYFAPATAPRAPPTIA